MSQYPRIPLTHWSEHELELHYASLVSASVSLKAMGRYALAAQVAAIRMEIYSELARRSSIASIEAGRQLSLAPPGAYDDPA